MLRRMLKTAILKALDVLVFERYILKMRCHIKIMLKSSNSKNHVTLWLKTIENAKSETISGIEIDFEMLFVLLLINREIIKYDKVTKCMNAMFSYLNCLKR